MVKDKNKNRITSKAIVPNKLIINVAERQPAEYKPIYFHPVKSLGGQKKK